MTGRNLEYRISQLADGTLPGDEQAALSAHVAGDPRAGQTFKEYRRLQSQLDRVLTTPVVRWDALAERLSTVVAEATEPPAVAGRIARSTPGWRRRVAIAAGLLVAAGAGLFAFQGRGAGPRPLKTAALPPSSVVVGPQTELARGNASVQITIGPSPAVALQGADWHYADGVVTAPPRVEFFSKVTAPLADDSHLH